MGGDRFGMPYQGFCWTCWNDKYGTKAPWMGVDYICLAKAHQAIGDDALARAAWERYLDSDDKFYEGHPPRLFLSSLNKWTARAVPKVQAATKPPKSEREETYLRLNLEVCGDPSIPRENRKAELSRRFRAIFPLDS